MVEKGKTDFLLVLPQMSHYKEACYALHGRPPKANVASLDDNNEKLPGDSVSTSVSAE